MKWLATGALALGLGFLAAPASAAPVVGVDGIKGGSSSIAEQVAYRRCWRHKGHRHCRWVGDNYGYGYPGYYSYGYGPGLGLYFGGGRYRGHHHGHRHR